MSKARLSSPRAKTGGLAIFGLAFAFLLTGCGNSSQPQQGAAGGPALPDGTDAGVTCIDNDNDGFGAGCVKGLDCNDKDPAITNECYKCNQNAQGCPCTQEGQSISCGELTADSSGCTKGLRVCSQGAWSACVSDGTATTGLPVGWTPKGLGGSTTACQNTPCDPYCQYYPDIPDPSLSNDAGIVGTDAGLQLAPTPVDAGPPQSCVSQTAVATPIPLDIFIMLDRSGSMSGDRWNSVVSAIDSFVDSSSAAGIGVGLGLFSYPGDTSCDVSTYATPRVAIAALPGNASAIKSMIASTSPSTNTPTTPALQGALQYAKSYATANPTHKVVVVLATDGEPNSCSPTCTVANVSSAAAAGYAGSPSIATYVIGVGGSTGNLTSIASSGGTGSPYMVTSGSSSSFLAAMQDIRQKALGCDYSLPTPSSGDLDPNATTISYQLGTGTATSISLAADAASCGSNDGFYYDNAANPTKLTLCPTTCTTVKSNAY
jgi:hypothetical protein